MNEKFYLTTAIDYVNGAPHIGHAYEKILSDVIIRHKRQLTDKAFMLTGTDEHGIKIQKTASPFYRETVSCIANFFAVFLCGFYAFDTSRST